MRDAAGWADHGHLNRCDRCGARACAPCYVDWDVPVLLNLCDGCQQLVAVEVWEQRRPALLAVYRQALAHARAAAAAAPAKCSAQRGPAEPV